MDGTLFATDALWESLLILVKTKPLRLLSLPFWLLKGKAYFKRQLALRVKLNPASLPYRENVLAFLKKEREAGRAIVLATAADEQVAQGVAAHLGLFAEVLASNGAINLSGHRKLEALKKNSGHNGFDYIGDAEVDLPLWQAAQQAYLVEPSGRLLGKARRVATVSGVFTEKKNFFFSLFKALRVYQWVKNILVFVPLLMAHKVLEVDLNWQALYAFIAFSLCASSVYIVNDLLDLEADRLHPHKRHRPFAAGTLPIKVGVFTAPLLLAGSFIVAATLLPLHFSLLLGSYFVLTTAYSFHLKRVLIIDVLVLAGLYTLRIFAGGIATDVPISPWLLAFSMFFFLNLAFVKRFSELYLMQENKQNKSKGRGYVVGDIDLFRSIGPASGYLAVVVLCFYINSKEVVPLYKHPEFLLLIGPFLLYWMTRMWLWALRGKMTDDPIVFTAKDPISYLIGAIVAVIMFMAWLW
ncbi:MAG: Protoheme IX farnesyltransferase [bacterium]|nr:Protoheme IX farnesyltransferase [bacterium]